MRPTTLAAALAGLLWAAAGSVDAANPALAGTDLQIGAATIALSFDEGKLDLPREAWLKWATDAAIGVRTYYGHFPVKRLNLRLSPQGARGIGLGTTWGFPKALIRVRVGEHTTAAALSADWILPHEMVHLAFPSVSDEHHWIEEGIATYVEPIARVQAGQLEVDEVWSQLVEGLPKGLPASGDRGLDYTHTWGRTYWGGALYCMLAEVRLREQTHNQKGLQDALRGIIARGGNIQADWSLDQALEAADAATGTSVLKDLYSSMRAAPFDVDLDALWRKLGVKMAAGKVVYDESAPEAAIRRAITQPGAYAPEG